MNRIELPVTNPAHIMNRNDDISDGTCRTYPDARRRRVLFRSWRPTKGDTAMHARYGAGLNQAHACGGFEWWFSYVIFV